MEVRLGIAIGVFPVGRALQGRDGNLAERGWDAAKGDDEMKADACSRGRTRNLRTPLAI